MQRNEFSTMKTPEDHSRLSGDSLISLEEIWDKRRPGGSMWLNNHNEEAQCP